MEESKTGGTVTNDTLWDLEEALRQNLAFQGTIQTHLDRLKNILVENIEKQVMGERISLFRLVKSKVSKFNIHKLTSTSRGPKRWDFFQIPHWMFETMDDETGTIAPSASNQDSRRYVDKFGCLYKMDHTVLRFTLSEGRQLARAISNHIRTRVLRRLHKEHRDDTMRLQEELDQIRIKDAKNPLWALHHEEYNDTIPWKRIAKEQMQGRTESECKVFWNGHVCIHNPNINRSRSWSKQSNESLKQIVEDHGERMWEEIAMLHSNKRTALQCAQQWMQKVKPKVKVDRKWTQLEESMLKDLVLKHGCNKLCDIRFMYIGSHFEHRTPLQCSSRWLKSSAPYIRSGEWDLNEDIHCVLSHDAYLPKKWPVINDPAYQRALVKRDKKAKPDDEADDDSDHGHGKDGKHSKEERDDDDDGNDNDNDNDDEHSSDEGRRKSKRLKKGKKKGSKKKKDAKPKKPLSTNPFAARKVGKHGVWVLIGRQIRFRNDVKARERYMNVLNPDIDIDSKWTPEEDAALMKYHEELGDKWAMIARKLGTNRTDCYCRQRVKQLRKKKQNLRAQGAEEISKTLQKSRKKPGPKPKPRPKRSVTMRKKPGPKSKPKPKPRPKAKPKPKPKPKSPNITLVERRKRKRGDDDNADDEVKESPRKRRRRPRRRAVAAVNTETTSSALRPRYSYIPDCHPIENPNVSLRGNCIPSLCAAPVAVPRAIPALEPPEDMRFGTRNIQRVMLPNIGCGVEGPPRLAAPPISNGYHGTQPLLAGTLTVSPTIAHRTEERVEEEESVVNGEKTTHSDLVNESVIGPDSQTHCGQYAGYRQPKDYLVENETVDTFMTNIPIMAAALSPIKGSRNQPINLSPTVISVHNETAAEGTEAGAATMSAPPQSVSSDSVSFDGIPKFSIRPPPMDMTLPPLPDLSNLIDSPLVDVS